MSGAPRNRQWLLARRPAGLPSRDDFEFREREVAPPGAGEVLVETSYISIDPAMRAWMSEARSYLPPVEIGEVMRAGLGGTVLESRDARFTPGDAVTGIVGVQSHPCARGDEWTKVDATPMPVRLSALGVPGITAYFGLTELAAAQPGDRVLVSGAGGAVGTMAGQIAKILGCKVVGIAGGEAKCRMLTEELGFDGAIDYKSEDVTTAIRAHYRRGVQVYFDNVGGPILDAALANLALRGRIVLCGAISQYNRDGETQGPKNYLSILVNRATVRGLLVFDYVDRYGEAQEKLAAWLAQGRLKAKVDIVEGIGQFPEALGRLFRGENTGKLLLRA